MPFKNYLDTRYLREIRMRELLRDFIYVTRDGEIITVPWRFRFDGGSIPPPARIIVGGPWSDDVFEASCIHDWLCLLARQGKYSRSRADSIFSQIIADGPKPRSRIKRIGKVIRRKIMYAGVRLGALGGWISKLWRRNDSCYFDSMRYLGGMRRHNRELETE